MQSPGLPRTFVVPLGGFPSCQLNFLALRDDVLGLLDPARPVEHPRASGFAP